MNINNDNIIPLIQNNECFDLEYSGHGKDYIINIINNLINNNDEKNIKQIIILCYSNIYFKNIILKHTNILNYVEKYITNYINNNMSLITTSNNNINSIDLYLQLLRCIISNTYFNNHFEFSISHEVSISSNLSTILLESLISYIVNTNLDYIHLDIFWIVVAYCDNDATLLNNCRNFATFPKFLQMLIDMVGSSQAEVTIVSISCLVIFSNTMPMGSEPLLSDDNIKQILKLLIGVQSQLTSLVENGSVRPSLVVEILILVHLIESKLDITCFIEEITLIIKLVFEIIPNFQMFSSLDPRFTFNFFSLLHKLLLNNFLSNIFCETLLSKYFAHFLNLLNSTSSHFYSTNHLFPLIPLLIFKLFNSIIVKDYLKNNKQLLSFISSLNSFLSLSPITVLVERIDSLLNKFVLPKLDLNIDFDSNSYFLLKYESLNMVKLLVPLLTSINNFDKSSILINFVSPEFLFQLINAELNSKVSHMSNNIFTVFLISIASMLELNLSPKYRFNFEQNSLYECIASLFTKPNKKSLETAFLFIHVICSQKNSNFKIESLVNLLIGYSFNKKENMEVYISKEQNIFPLVNTNVQLQNLLKKAHDEIKLRELMYNELVTSFEKEKHELINQHLEELNKTILRFQQSVLRANSDSDARASAYEHEINEKSSLIVQLEKSHNDLLSKFLLFDNEISTKDKVISKLEYELLSSNSSLSFIKNKQSDMELNDAIKDAEVNRLKTESSNLNNKVLDLTKNIKSKTEKLEKSLKQIVTLTKLVSTKDKTIEEIENKFKSVENILEDKNFEIIKITNNCKNLENDKVEISKRYGNLETKYKERNADNLILKEEQDETRIKMNALIEENAKLKQNVENLKETNLKQKNSIKSLETKLVLKEEMLNKHASLAAMIKSLSNDLQSTSVADN